MPPFEPIVLRSPASSRFLALVAARSSHARRRVRLGLGPERLEERAVLSSLSLLVTSLADTGPGTLRTAITEADARSAAQTYNIKFKVSGTLTLESALPALSNTMTLSGPGEQRLTVHRDRNASTDFAIFTVDSGAAVRITGMTLSGGIEARSGSGGGISNNGTLTVTNTSISGNSAYDGGGVSNNGSLTLSHSRISRNQANQFGGGVYNNGTLTVSDSNTSSNLALISAGGIYNTGKLTVSHATISSNGAVYDGGGIYSDNSGIVAVTHTIISGNEGNSYLINPTAYPSGGGVYNTGIFTVSGTTITRNSSYLGGGIYNNGTLTESHNTISRNKAGGETLGGGIIDTVMLTVNKTTVSGNPANADIVFLDSNPSGGGIYNDNAGKLTESHTTISHNVTYDGAGIYNSGTLIENNDTISFNLAENPGPNGIPPLVVSDTNAHGGSPGDDGGAIDNSGTLTAKHDSISRNAATAGGGLENTGTLTFSHTTVSRNRATTGGGLDNSGSGRAELDYSTLNDPAGGGIVNDGSTVHLKKTVVDGIVYIDKAFS